MMKYSAVKKSTQYAVMITCTIMLICSTTLNAGLSLQLYSLGVELISTWQTPSNPAFNFLNNIISFLCFPTTPGLILGLALIMTKRKMRSLIYVSYFLFTAFIVALLKTTFQQGRPFWTDAQINIGQQFCPHDFGHPSGHSFAFLPIYQPLFSDYFGMGKFSSIIVVLTITNFLVPFSRMYLGAHSLDQVAYGCLLGTGCLVMYRYILQELSYRLMSRMLKKNNVKLHWTSTAIAHLSCMAVSLGIYIINSQERTVDPVWTGQILMKCGKSLTGADLQGKSLASCAVASAVFGILYGMLLLQPRKDTVNYFSGLFEFTSQASAFKHTLTVLLSAAIPALFFGVLLPGWVQIPVADFLLISLGFTLAGMSFLLVPDILGRKHKWYSLQNQLQFS